MIATVLWYLNEGTLRDIVKANFCNELSSWKTVTRFTGNYVLSHGERLYLLC